MILEGLRQRKCVGAISRETGHDRRTIERIAAEHGIEPVRRMVLVPPEVQTCAARLLETTHVTVGELAESCGVSVRTLRRRLHKAGVRGYGRHLRPADRQRIDSLLAAGLETVAVARAVGCHVRTVQRCRRRLRDGAPLAAAS